MNQDQRREALAALEKCDLPNSSCRMIMTSAGVLRVGPEITFQELQDYVTRVWLSSWELATEATYQECANACDVNGDLCAAELIRQIAKGDQP